MPLFVELYLTVGVLVGFGLYGWLAVSSVRRHGFRAVVRGAGRSIAEELPLYWRVPVAAWTFVIGLPIVAVWAILDRGFDASGAISLAVLWLIWLALLRWHLRVKNAPARK